MPTIYEAYQQNRDKDVTKKYLTFLFEHILEKELEPYVLDFKIERTSPDALGTYSSEDRVLTLYKDNINNSRVTGDIPASLFAIEVLRHEIEHARNLATLEKGKKDIESLIVKYTLRDYAIKHGLDSTYQLDSLDPDYVRIKMQDNYEIDPGERLADIRSWQYVVNLIKNQRTSHEMFITRFFLHHAYVRGYVDRRSYMDAPTLSFLLNTGMFHDFYWLKKQMDQKDYCFDTRILYGLPITKEEYSEKVLEKVKLQRKRTD